MMSFYAQDGGTDANDWAEMLMRMYSNWAQKHGYSIETARPHRRRRRRDSKREHRRSRAARVWLSQRRDGHASPGAHQPVQFGREADDELRGG